MDKRYDFKARFAEVGLALVRKSDNARGTIVARALAVSSFSRPGVYGKVVVTVRLDDAGKRASAGGDMVGDLGWLRSHFRKATS